MLNKKVRQTQIKQIEDRINHHFGYSDFKNDCIILLSEIKTLKLENMCDVCCGTGRPESGSKCMCDGSGLMSVASTTLREKMVYYEMENKIFKSAIERALRDAEKLKNQLKPLL